MSTTITIGNTPLEIPNPGDSPDWGEAITTAIEDLATAQSAVVGPYDVPLQSFIIDAFNPGISGTIIPALKFPVNLFPAVTLTYAVYRDTSSVSAYEAGILTFLYQNAGSPFWLKEQNYVGNSHVTFDINSTGQVIFTCSTLAGTGHTGRIVFKASVLVINT